MSRELMAECMSEAAALMRERNWADDATWYPCVATIACALYQERCRIVQAPPATGVLRVGEEWCNWEAPVVYEGQGDEKPTFVGRADVGNS